MSQRVCSGALFVLVALVAFAFGCALAAELQPIPALADRVTDLTGTLAAPERAALDATLAALEQRKGAQVAILLVSTTSPETIEQYATRVYDAWKLGRNGVDDGVLILVAKDDHRVRIEVAYGLEGAIPDAAAKRIAHDYMSPKFREGDFAGGLAAGVEMLRRLVDEEPLPEPAPSAARRADPTRIIEREPWWSPVVLVAGILFGAFVGVVVLLVVRSRVGYGFLLGHFPARARTCAFGAIVALPITLLLRHPAGALGAFAAAVALASLANLSQPPRRRELARRSGSAAAAGLFSTGASAESSSSGSSDSGSSGGGDFSGGGGSSGGGGASDSW
ncbi:MAG: YgcG family protein [Rhodanobacteraceae bacterium]